MRDHVDFRILYRTSHLALFESCTRMESAPTKTLPDILRAAKESGGLSGSEIARKAGLTASTLFTIKSGKHVPNLKRC